MNRCLAPWLLVLVSAATLGDDYNAKAIALESINERWKEFESFREFRQGVFSPYIEDPPSNYVTRTRPSPTRLDPLLDQGEWLEYLAASNKAEWSIRRDGIVDEISRNREAYARRSQGFSLLTGETVAVGGCIAAAWMGGVTAPLGAACLSSQFLVLGQGLILQPFYDSSLNAEEKERLNTIVDNNLRPLMETQGATLLEAGEAHFRKLEELRANPNLTSAQKQKVLRALSDPEYVTQPSVMPIDDNIPLHIELRKTAADYYDANRIYAANANSAVALVDELFGADSLPSELRFVVGAYGASIEASQQLATGNYFGAALSVVRVFGGSAQSNPMAPVMAALDVVNRKLDFLIEGQQRILENQRRIIEKLDQIHTDVLRLEDQQYLLSSRILRAINASTHTTVGRCVRVANELRNALIGVHDGWQSEGTLSKRVYDNFNLMHYAECFDLVDRVSVDLENNQSVEPYFAVRTNPGNDGNVQEVVSQSRFFRDTYTPLFDYYWQRAHGVKVVDNDLSCPSMLGDPGFRGKHNAAFSSPFYLSTRLTASASIAELSETEINRVIESFGERRSCLLNELIVFDELIRLSKTFAETAWIQAFLARNNAAGGVLRAESTDAEKFLEETADLTVTREGQSNLRDLLTLLELARAQTAILDGRAIGPYLIRDLLAGESADQFSDLESVVKITPTVGQNFLSALIGGHLVRKDRSLAEYGGVLAMREPLAVADWLEELLGTENLSIEVRCSRLSEDCAPNKAGTYFSDMEVRFSRRYSQTINGQEIQETYVFDWLELPGSDYITQDQLVTHSAYNALTGAIVYVEDELSMYSLQSSVLGAGCNESRTYSRSLPSQAWGFGCGSRKKSAWKRYQEFLAVDLLDSGSVSSTREAFEEN